MPEPNERRSTSLVIGSCALIVFCLQNNSRAQWNPIPSAGPVDTVHLETRSYWPGQDDTTTEATAIRPALTGTGYSESESAGYSAGLRQFSPLPRSSSQVLSTERVQAEPRVAASTVSVQIPSTGQQGGSATLEVPLRAATGGNSQVRLANGRVSIFAQSAELRTVLSQLAEESDVDIVVAENVDAKITTSLTDIPLWDALDAILKINGLVWTRNGEIIFVSRPQGGATANANLQTSMPGQDLQVFDLHYTSSEEVLAVVTGLLSPAGRAFAHKADINSTRQTRERIVVEDYPQRLQAIAMYLASVDNPPRQVLIEAHVLQVTLDNEQRHGVNLLGIARLAGARVNVTSQGFANSNSSPGFMMGLEGTDLDGMIEMLCQSSAVQTLAAPKVLCVNGQEARIQIGSKFGYFVTTTTQTSTLQSVDFLDIGVVLQVQPIISRDGQVLLTVQPKVSGGRINPDSGLPEEETTEASTTVLLPDGKGMIIGGLIKESDDNKKWWAPWLGRQPIIGKLFSRTNDDHQRVEVIIALTTHIVPYEANVNCREYQQYLRSTEATAVQDTYVDYIRDFKATGPQGNQPEMAETEETEQEFGLIEQVIPIENFAPTGIRVPPSTSAEADLRPATESRQPLPSFQNWQSAPAIQAPEGR